MSLILNFFNNIYNHKRYLIIFIFLISIFCSLFFLFFFRNIGPSQHGIPGNDYFTYYEPIAISILQGEGLTPGKNLFLNVPPGFPLFLSGTFILSRLTGIDKFDLIILFNIIITALSCCFLFLIAKEIFSKKIALIASLLWMSYPFNLWFIKNPNTEVLFILLLYVSLWLYILGLKRGNLRFSFLGGIILGLVFLTRLISLFLLPFLFLMTFFFLRGSPKSKQFLLAIVLLIGYLVIFLPLGIYSFSETGSFILPPTTGPISTMAPRGIVYGITFIATPGEGSDRIAISDDVMALIERVGTEDLSSTAKVFKFFTQELINRPIPLLKLIGLKLTRSWYATSQQWWEKEILAIQLLYLVTAFGGILYVIKTAKDKFRDIILLLSIVFYFWGMTFLAVSIFRYMIPVMGLVIIFSAITVSIVIDRLVRKIRPC